MAAIRRHWLDVLLFELVGVGMGMLIGVFISDDAQTISGYGDTTNRIDNLSSLFAVPSSTPLDS